MSTRRSLEGWPRSRLSRVRRRRFDVGDVLSVLAATAITLMCAALFVILMLLAWVSIKTLWSMV